MTVTCFNFRNSNVSKHYILFDRYVVTLTAVGSVEHNKQFCLIYNICYTPSSHNASYKHIHQFMSLH